MRVSPPERLDEEVALAVEKARARAEAGEEEREGRGERVGERGA